MADMMSDLTLIFAEANRNNTSIYAVDPRGLAPFEYDINQGVGLQVDKMHLDRRARQPARRWPTTPTAAPSSTATISRPGMQQIIRDSSGYYLLGYNSTQAPTDGRFHAIEVEVTRRGVDVRARKGYWAYTAEDAARATAPRSRRRRRRSPRRLTALVDTGARPSGALLDRDRARRDGQVARHVRLGADCRRRRAKRAAPATPARRT